MAEFTAKDTKDWRAWLEKNHLRETKITLIKYKKHTGKASITNREAMDEAICFGWIDTTAKRIDEDRYSQNFAKRNEKSKWSKNTLARGKELLSKGLMSEYGIKMYKEGFAKGAYDAHMPEDIDTPEIIKKIVPNKRLQKAFLTLPKSLRKMHTRQILMAKLPETIKQRQKKLISILEDKMREKNQQEGTNTKKRRK